MNNDDVILTPSERENLCKQCIGYGECDSTICQKHLPLQCLKLLDVLKSHYQLPKDTIVYPNLLVMSGQQVDELEKLLRF